MDFDYDDHYDEREEDGMKRRKHLTSPPPRKKSKFNNEIAIIKNEAQNGCQKNIMCEDVPMFIVKSCKANPETNLKELEVTSYKNEHIVICYLYDSWTNCLVNENDMINILCDADEKGNYHVKDKSGYIIVNPQYILSGTTILSSVFCNRKASLSWFFKDTSSTSSHMLLGNLLHTLFQEAISKKLFQKNELSAAVNEILRRKVFISDLYKSKVNENELLTEALIYLDSIEKWLREHVKAAPKPLNAKQAAQKSAFNKTASNNDDFQILKVCDIEESIWSPKYGVKGNLDLTLQIEKKAKTGISATTLETIPVELKSGRSTFSIEHEGQVMLYSLLNKEKRKEFDYGLLLYLKDTKMKFIKATQNHLKGLIQLRNDLVHYINSKNFPAELKNEDRVCSKCSLLTVCSLFNEKEKSSKAQCEIQYERDIELYANSIKHLSDEHKRYFFNWYKMLEIEYQNDKQFEADPYVWVKPLKELEDMGFTVGNLRLITTDIKEKLEIDSEKDSEAFYTLEFQREKSESVIKQVNIKENDMILLSSQSNHLVGISQGFVKSIKNQNRTFVLVLNRDITNSPYKIDAFRIDKINYRSAICANYTNLMKLMDDSQRCKRLREYIVEKARPTFERVLPKQAVLKTKNFFKKLNQSQQAAILKTLMANDYLLIKGYPGTGKTSTIAALVAVLVTLGKKVLFTSFTNSAVDNLLLKIIKDYDIDFVRVGSSDRIHADVKKYDSNSLTSAIATTKELKEFYEKKSLIATTCSSINHAAFSQIEFDYCIVDEASQVLQTVCLGPLFISKKFVLVGDAEQLPPVIRNKEARAAGMGVSLFEYLDSSEGSVELVHQYRMNSEIMSIANEISYFGKLKCISDEVANKKVKMSQEFLQQVKSNALKKLAENSVIFLDTTELLLDFDASKSDNKKENIHFNLTECKIVSILSDLFYKHSDCSSSEYIGVIAPYNEQVRTLQNYLNANSSMKNIEINTVDQFQGRDKKIIMCSFTNSVFSEEETKEQEILNDKRRLTVAITRAKEKLILIGCVKNLNRYKPLQSLINSVSNKNCVVKLKNLAELNLD